MVRNESREEKGNREEEKRENGKEAKNKDIWRCVLREREKHKKKGGDGQCQPPKKTTAGHNSPTHPPTNTYTHDKTLSINIQRHQLNKLKTRLLRSAG